ncbi:MFS transporter [Arcanobacterium bovis]|uniref:MFS transporter n=1 Tax=Arcanobacterium bovis TaxID=2529275 RepID=A0A4Q9V1R0_9ACTO|nr:MFS transporter [Arcanobacterium bovis]TBW22050.1 MFS transporter [Arcanobacterium bovis]
MSHSTPATQELRSGDSSRIEKLTKTNFGKLMPLLVIVYIISFIDRTNIGMAKEALGADIGLSAGAYGLGAGLFFLCYAVLEIPSNLIMHKVGARFWITRIMITWGIISMAMALVWNDTSFYVLRILLGAAEAGLYPGIILYISYWFPQKFRPRAIGIFLLGVSIANIVGAPIAGMLLQMDGIGGLHGWQWMFIIEGAPAVLLAFLVWKLLPNSPREAKWLSDDDKSFIERIIASEDVGEKSQHNDLRSLGPVVSDPIIWLVVLAYFTHQIAVYSLSYFLPTMIKSYDSHMSTLTVGFITAIPWIAAALGSWFLPRYAVGLKKSKMMASAGFVTVAVGLTIAALTSTNIWIAVIGFFIAASQLFVIQSILFTFPQQRFSGATAAAAVAFMNMCGLAGGFLGPTVMGYLEQSTGNKLAGLWFIIGAVLIGSLLVWGLRYRTNNVTHQVNE